MTIKDWCNSIGKWAKSKGWNSKVTDENPSKFGEQIALMTTELSEAFEAFRDGKPLDHTYFLITKEIDERYSKGMVTVDEADFEKYTDSCKPEGVPSELADCVIRIFHFCHDNDIDLEKIIMMKMKYNETRAYRHGGKKA